MKNTHRTQIDGFKNNLKDNILACFSHSSDLRINYKTSFTLLRDNTDKGAELAAGFAAADLLRIATKP